MQAAQIYTRQFSSLQPDLRTWDPGIRDFVEALTNMFMNFSFATWIHSSRNPALASNKNISANYDITSGYDVVSKNFIKKLTVSDIRRLCERLGNFWEPWCVGAWEWALKIFPKSNSARHCSLLPKLQLPSKLFAALASYNKTTLHTAETWLTVTITFSKFEKFSLWCPLSKQWMTLVCGRSLAGGTDIKCLMTS